MSNPPNAICLGRRYRLSVKYTLEACQSKEHHFYLQDLMDEVLGKCSVRKGIKFDNTEGRPKGDGSRKKIESE